MDINSWPANKPKRLWDATTLAFILALYENCYQKWRHAISWYRKDVQKWGEKIPKAIPKKMVTQADGTVVKVKQPDPFHDTLYSIGDGGQNSYTTWKNEGIDRYKSVANQLHNMRKDKRVKAKMDDMDEKIRKMLEEQFNANRPSSKRSKKRKLATVEAPKKKSRLDLGFEDGLGSDDEDDDGNNGGNGGSNDGGNDDDDITVGEEPNGQGN